MSHAPPPADALLGGVEWNPTGTDAAARLAGADPVLFDLDGTITASGPGILASVRAALAALDEPLPDEAALARFIGPPLVDSFMVECAMDADRAWQAVLAYRRHYGEHGQYENAVYDGIPEVLAALRGAGRRLVVATSKAEPYARSILAHFDLLGAFDDVVGSELDGSRTAKAEVVAEALRRVAPSTAGSVLVGDRSHDVVGACAAGIPAIGALWGYGSAEELRTAGAAVLVAQPRDLLAVLLA
ncbi:MAG: HAD hydrolase-like protein [Candidatus Nanopelagicales bacterium]|nr:HAD hydrolase-like protein [Candidatus Nanopelagicales bacterium]